MKAKGSALPQVSGLSCLRRIGISMNYRLSAAAAVAFLALGGIIGTHMLAGASVTTSPPPVSSVTITSGSVEVTNRVDVSATTPPDTWLAVAGDAAGTRLTVEVPAGLNVNNTVGVTGSVELGPTSAALLAGRTCTYGALGHILVDGGVQDIAGMAGRTGITMVAHAFDNGVDYVSCWPGNPDGGQSPNCTIGSGGVGMPIHNGGAASFDVSNAYVVRCLACVHSGGGGTTALLGGANSQCTP